VTSSDSKPGPIQTSVSLDAEDGFFDASLLAELEELAASHAGPGSPLAISATLHRQLEAFLQPGATGAGGEITEDEFVALPGTAVAERTGRLLAICRQAGENETVRTVESFTIFFQTLLPTLREERAAREVKRFFFRLAPTLIHIAYNDFSATDDRRNDGRAALQSLESVLIEISGVRLTPSESELAFRSIDQMGAFIGVGEYAMATEVISSQLLAIIGRNRLMRSLFRLMEVEVNVQRYLREKLGYLTPQIRVPQDFGPLAEYGPLRVLREPDTETGTRFLIQVQIPDIPILRDIVLHLAQTDGSRAFDLRMDALGSAEIDVPPGVYSIGLVYQPHSS
jgi:hypothetical protein